MKKPDEDDNIVQGIVIKAKLELKKPDDAAKFIRSMEQYRQACNYISEYIFANDFIMSQLKLQKILYRDLRDKFGLKSMMAQSAIRSTIARYKTVREQLWQNPLVFQDVYTEEWHEVEKNLYWLKKPVKFRRPQIDLVRKRDWSKRSDGMLSINTLDGRVIATPTCKGFDQYFDGTWKFGGAKLLRGRRGWMLHISATKDLGMLEDLKFDRIVGIDRGIRFLATTFDNDGKCRFFSGKEVMRKRMQYAATRERLQQKHTWSAKRALKRLEHRENRLMTEINHCISKTLVNQYGPNTLFVLEDLKGVSLADKNLTRLKKNGRQQHRSWAFYQLEMFLTYKARLCGGNVVKFSPKYTSQRCPRCGEIHKEYRHHKTHEYICGSCGEYRANDDLTGARNIFHLGEMYVCGVKNPKYKKPKEARKQ